MSAEIPSAPKIRIEHLPGVTLSKVSKYPNDVSIVPQKYFHHELGQLIDNSKVHSLEGIIRHEAAQQLSKIYKWSDFEGIYNCRRTELLDLIGDLDKASMDMSEKNRIRKLKNLLYPKYLEENSGFYQTIADIYAIAHGGSPTPKVDKVLQESFEGLFTSIASANWFRK